MPGRFGNMREKCNQELLGNLDRLDNGDIKTELCPNEVIGSKSMHSINRKLLDPIRVRVYYYSS